MFVAALGPNSPILLFFNFFSMFKGTVKFFNESKGFGFIVDDSSGEEIFVHVSGLIDDIREGDKVTFETARGKKGMNAVNVQRA
jgi:CspA family cold shock protein